MRRRVEQHRRQDARPQSANELTAFAQRLTRFGLWFGGALILAAALLIGIDVTLRKFFNASIGGADEVAGYALALGTAWSLGATLLDRAHIRIDSLYVLFPRPLRLALDFAGIALSELYSKLPLTLAIGEMAWATSNNFLLVAIPFFVLLGEILLRSGMAERMYNALVLWVPWLPGGLMHSNIAACAMFAATSGSSVATAATIGTVALGEVEKRGYSERLFLGTIAAGGTLGILIPPSINMIVYGVLTETSIPKLYLAGFIPGVILA